MFQFNDVHKKIFDYMVDEVKNGHEDYSTVSFVKLGVDSAEFIKACLELRRASVIHCTEHPRGEDPLPLAVFDIHFTDESLKSI